MAKDGYCIDCGKWISAGDMLANIRTGVLVPKDIIVRGVKVETWIDTFTFDCFCHKCWPIKNEKLVGKNV